MSAPARLAAFGLAALVALGGGVAVGAAVGPAPSSTPVIHPQHEEPPATEVPATTDHGHSLGEEHR